MAQELAAAGCRIIAVARTQNKKIAAANHTTRVRRAAHAAFRALRVHQDPTVSRVGP